MIEFRSYFNAGHESVEAGGDRRPFSVLFAYSFLRKYLEVDLLVLS